MMDKSLKENIINVTDEGNLFEEGRSRFSSSYPFEVVEDHIDHMLNSVFNLDRSHGNLFLSLNLLILNYYMEAYEPKCVNPVLNSIGVNSLKLGGLHILKLVVFKSNLVDSYK